MRKPFRLVPDKPYVAKEYEEQTAVFEWLKWCKLPGADMAYATMNGVRLPIGLARKMKKAGLCAGPPDINLDCARRGFHGLRVEMKREKGGTLSEAQKSWHIRLQEEGFKVEVARGANEAIQIIKSYLEENHAIV